MRSSGPGSAGDNDDALPIDTLLDDLRAALRRGHVVLSAPTGSGKSTRVPLALLDEPWLAGRRILMLQPRRPAARMVAARLAECVGEPIGERVGYQIRFERRRGPRTRIEVITEGILTRRIQSDPMLEGVGLLIFDEIHERSLHADLGLALTLDLIEALRPDLRLLLMSATLEADPLVERLGAATLIQAEGRAYPVEIQYAERAPGPDPVTAMVAAIQGIVREDSGDILAFLPGAAEIERCVGRLRERLDDDIAVLPLHGGLPVEAQAQALAPSRGPERRVLVATDIAETSLTIPGIRTVIDSGLARKPRFDAASGLTHLVTEPIARASADQRAGRAGRLGPGRCLRLWTRAQEVGRPARRPPEILDADLAALVLELALWGTPDPAALRWLDPPPAPAWAHAVALLAQLGALDAKRTITPLGRRMAELPVHPRLAAMLLGASRAGRDPAADLCALLGERDPLLLETSGRRRPADLGLRLQALEDWRAGRRDPGVDTRRLAVVERAAQQLRRLVRDAPPGTAEMPAELLLLAYPDRVAQRRAGDDERYRLAAGPGARLPRDDALSLHPYLVVARLDAAGADGRIELALPIAETELRAGLGTRLRVTRELAWDEAREAVGARLIECYASLTLGARPVPLAPTDAVTPLLIEQIGARFEQMLDWSEAARQLVARVDLMRRIEPEGGWPDLRPETLRASLDDWLAPALDGITRLAQLRALDLAAILATRLDWPLRQRLDAEAPTRLQTPAGTSRRIDYCAGATPVLAVQLQELFGLAETPRIARGRQPLLLHLLSPARRPIQVTQDLAGFWARGYAEVRKELRGRYPKHPWPDDPTTAPPSAGAKRARRS